MNQIYYLLHTLSHTRFLPDRIHIFTSQLRSETSEPYGHWTKPNLTDLAQIVIEIIKRLSRDYQEIIKSY